MSDLALRCRNARLDWTQPGGPRAADYGDVYYSVEDGLEETRAVFLQACDLPAAWAGRQSYVVGELGFGTGLNVLALWDLWRETAPAGGWLHILSIEKHPLTREDAARALADWPQLSHLSQRLLDVWPSALKGAHRIIFPDDRFSLTIFHDEAESALAGIEARVDCWFLDGFAPARNERMWSQTVLDGIGRLSALGARIGTFTVAGAVRRGLQAAGFEVEKRPGFGRKRERLEAVYAGHRVSPDPSPFARTDAVEGRVAILGAGIAGASLAHALHRRGRDTVLIDPLGPAGGASGAPAGLLTPRLERADRPHVRATLAAFEYARTLYGGMDGFFPEGVLRQPRDDSEAERLAALAALMGEGYAFDGSALLIERAGRFDPGALVRGLAGAVPVVRRACTRVEETVDGLRLYSASGQVITEADAVIHATGAAVGSIIPDVSASAGLLAVLDGVAPVRPQVWGGYAAAVPGGGVLLGATHVKGTDPGSPETAIEDFRAALARHAPDIAAGLGRTVRQTWSGVRASTPDRHPVSGPVPGPDFDAFWAQHARGGPRPEPRDEAPTRQFILSGLGSRGFAHAPLLAEDLVSQICGEPGALEREGRLAFHPARFAWRRLKRG